MLQHEGAQHGRPATGRDGVPAGVRNASMRPRIGACPRMADRRPIPDAKAGSKRRALDMDDGRARLAILCQTVVGVRQPALQSVGAESPTVREPNGTSLGAIPTAMGALTRLAYA